MNFIDMIAQETAESYLSSLLDLTSNNKTLINVLTILAEENINYGQTIVDTISRRINEVEPDLKLPILYLIDSIIKNVGGKYIEFFRQSIVGIFMEAFEKVNADIRKKFYKLRQTWNDIFPVTILCKIDDAVKSIDFIRMNKKKRSVECDDWNEPNKKTFKLETVDMLFGGKDIDLRILQSQNIPGISETTPKYSCDETIENGQKFKIFQRSQEQEKTEQMANRSATLKNNRQLKLPAQYDVCDVILQGGSNQPRNKWISPWKKQVYSTAHSSVSFKPSQKPINRAKTYKNKQHFHQIPSGNRIFNRNYHQISRNILPFNSIVSNSNVNSLNCSYNNSTQPADYNNQSMGMSEVSNKPVEINVQKLFQNLLKFGIINNLKEKPALNKPETLKKRNSSAVSALYLGWQCSSCGIRFPADQTTKHRDHLDWHFQQNRREKEAFRPHQKWYNSAVDWAQIGTEEEEKISWFETETNSQATLNGESNFMIPNCTAAHDEFNEVCFVCDDPFEMFYDDEAEEWYLRNAIRKGKQVFHPICCEDF